MLALMSAWIALAPLSDARRWAALAWLSVAVLPITWTYSLLPLLPWLLWGMARGGLPERFWAAVAFGAVALIPEPGSEPGLLSAALCAAGLSLAFGVLRDARSAVHPVQREQATGNKVPSIREDLHLPNRVRTAPIGHPGQ